MCLNRIYCYLRDLKVVKFILTQKVGNNSAKTINSKRSSKVGHEANKFLP